MAEVDSGEASRMPSQTIYLSNLNEKVRKEGTATNFESISSPGAVRASWDYCYSSSNTNSHTFHRTSALLVCAVLTVRTDLGHCLNALC